MKRSLFSLLVAALLLSSPSQASHMKLGVGAGINIANLSVSAGSLSVSGNSGAKLGFGLDLDIEMNEWLSLDPGLMYLGQGVDGLTLSYLELPLLAAAKFGSDTAKFVIQLGPSIGFKLSGTGTKTINFSLQAGLGGEFNVGHMDIFINARYLLGLADVNSPSVANSSTKTKGILFLAGVKFPLGSHEGHSHDDHDH